MSGLSTADLDELGRRNEMRGLARAEIRDLIKAARLQVALDELPLPEGCFVQVVGQQGGPAIADAIGPGVNLATCQDVPGSTMLAAVLSLGDALRSRA